MQENANSNYQSYNAMVSQTMQGLRDLGDICESLQMQEHVTKTQALQQRMKDQTFSVGIMGEFRRGKSTVINALLGTEIVPSDVVPTSATLNYIRWDTTPRAVVNFKDGTEKEVPVEELKNYITKTTKENEQMAATVENAEVYYPCRFCQNGVQIIDTPGLNDDERMTEIAEKVIPTLDAVVMVMSAEIPLSESEAKFLREKIMLSDLGRVIFVVNKIDLLRRKDDRARVLANIRGRITESVLEKMAMVYGRDSEEYRGASDKMGDIRLFGISSLDALEGRMNGDEEMVEKSGILEFEAALSKMLTEERGLLELAGPVNTMTGIAQQARTAIAMRRETLSMDRQELEATCEEGMRATTEARNRVKAQIADLKQCAAGLYQDLLPDVTNAYQSIEQELLDYVDNVEITAEDLDTDKKAEAKGQAISEEIGAKTEQKLNAATQALLVKMQTRVGEDLAQMEESGQEIFSDIAKVQQKLTGGSKGGSLENYVNLATSACGIFGVGPLINGWKEHGLPGALLGGGVGFVSGTAVAYGSGILVATLLSVAVPALPFFLIGGVVGSVAGKTVVNKIFKTSDKRVQQLRAQLREYVTDTMKSVKSARALENWLEKATGDIYESISEKMDEEVEATLVGFERNLADIKLNRQKQSGEMDAILEEMDELEHKLDKIETQMQPIDEKLRAALSSPADAA